MVRVLNSSMADSGVAKSQCNEVEMPCFESGKDKVIKPNKRKKIKISVWEPLSGRNSGLPGITSRPLLGQNSWEPLGLNMSKIM